MIQGCRYLRRSTDRWTLLKNSTTRLKDSRVWCKAGLLWECFRCNYIHPGFIFIPVVVWLLVDYAYNIWYLIYRPSTNTYPSIHPFRSGHVTTQSREISANSRWTEANCRPQVSLPNPFEETFLPWTGFFTKLDPQIRLLPIPNFGVNNTLSSSPNIIF
jgi:hypothetical protein